MSEARNLVADIASSIISGERPMLPAPSSASPTPEQWQSEAIKGYIIAYFHAALTNVCCQAYLLPAEQVNENGLLKGVIDTSYAHFCMLDNWFAALAPNELQSNLDSHLYEEVRDVWKPWVRDWRTLTSKGSQRTGSPDRR